MVQKNLALLIKFGKNVFLRGCSNIFWQKFVLHWIRTMKTWISFNVNSLHRLFSGCDTVYHFHSWILQVLDLEQISSNNHYIRDDTYMHHSEIFWGVMNIPSFVWNYFFCFSSQQLISIEVYMMLSKTRVEDLYLGTWRKNLFWNLPDFQLDATYFQRITIYLVRLHNHKRRWRRTPLIVCLIIKKFQFHILMITSQCERDYSPRADFSIDPLRSSEWFILTSSENIQAVCFFLMNGTVSNFSESVWWATI